jgi:3'(2'), 5'-bisphosphate nucleotidase
MTASPANDHIFAAHLAEAAGRLLLSLRHEPPVGADLGGAGDRASHRFLVDAIRRCHPADAILSEEAADDAGRLTADRVWIIDPLDGTREFTEDGREDWAVHVALWQRGALAAAAVALPARAIVLSTAIAFPQALASIDGPLRFLVSRTRPPAIAAHVARVMNAQLVPRGSAGAKSVAVVLGEADAYIHAGGQYEWDSAAPAAVAGAAGLHVSRLDGSPLRYNQRDPSLPDLVVCRPGLADALLRTIASATGTSGSP